MAFKNQTIWHPTSFQHLYTRLVWYSDSHFIYNALSSTGALSLRLKDFFKFSSFSFLLQSQGHQVGLPRGVQHGAVQDLPSQRRHLQKRDFKFGIQEERSSSWSGQEGALHSGNKPSLKIVKFWQQNFWRLERGYSRQSRKYDQIQSYKITRWQNKKDRKVVSIGIFWLCFLPFSYSGVFTKLCLCISF